MYFIQCGEGGPIKIGISHNPNVRLRALQTAAPYQLRLVLASGPVAHAERYEAWLHALHADSRLNGEWFLPSAALLSHINQIRAFDAHVEAA